MKILYFAWLRQKIGTGEETVDPPPEIGTIEALVDWLRGRSPGHAAAFANAAIVRAAVNHEFATPSTPIAAGDEIAFFPPMTGG